MRWPWNKRGAHQRLCLRLTPELFAYVLSDGTESVQRWGALWRDGEDETAFSRRIAALGLQAAEVIALLEPQDYQIFKVDTPPVPPAEMKAAARWLIKELVDLPLDELTLDVMHVGHDAQRSPAQLFVVAARNAPLQQLAQGVSPLRLTIADIWETSLRNLQAAAAAQEGLRARACAALLWREHQPALLCVSVAGELHYSRRIDTDVRLLERALRRDTGTGPHAPGPALEFAAPDDNGMVDYSAGDEDSPLIIELQRSIDVWERSAPELPLARLFVVAAEHGAALASLLQRELGLRSSAIELTTLLPGLKPDGRARELSECLPLLGAALRDSGKEL